MTELAERVCVPCRGGIPPLAQAENATLLAQLNGHWQVVNNHHLRKTYRLKDFKEALAFTNRVGEMAESIGHHPDIALVWGKVTLEVWTHKIDGLTESDFIFAAKCDRLV